MAEKIILQEWKRGEIFEFFSGVSDPFYMVTFRQDVTELYKYVKEEGLSFYYSMIYLCVKAMNSIDAFRYVIRDGEVWHIDRREPSFTDLHPGEEEFHIVTMPASGSMAEFCREARSRSLSQTSFIDMSAESDELIYISCLPWLDITGLTNERDLAAGSSRDESIPHLTWGRLVRAVYPDEKGVLRERMETGISIEVNHRLIDGIHIGKFAEALTEQISGLVSASR